MKCYLIEDRVTVIEFFKRTFPKLNKAKKSKYEFHWVDEKGDISKNYPSDKAEYLASDEFKQKVALLAEDDACFFIDLALNDDENILVQKFSNSLGKYTARTAIDIIKTILEKNKKTKIIIISTIPEADDYWEKIIRYEDFKNKPNKFKFITSYAFDPTNPELNFIHKSIVDD